MASASAAKSASAFITLMSRRGYAASASSQGAAAAAVSSPTTRFMLKKKGSPVEAVKSAWAPDPVTGYYRPENHAKDIDAAELRRVLLSKNGIRKH